MNDLVMIPNVSGAVTFHITGASADTGLMLLQRLYVMLLSDPSGAYRSSDGGVTLYNFLDGGNIPTDPEMNAWLALSCPTALSMLDQEDQDNIESFSGISEDGIITLYLVLIDGTTVEGKLKDG